MHAGRPKLPLVIGLVLSIAAHVTILLPLFIASFESEGRFHYLQARFDPDDFDGPKPEEENPEERDTPLGLDIDTPSTLTWVGYEEYEKHIAALAATDQAAFTDVRTAVAPTEPTQILSASPSEDDADAAVADPAPEASEASPAELDPEQLIAMRRILDALGRALTDPVRHQSPPRPEPAATEDENPQAEDVDDAEPTPVSPPKSGEADQGDPADRESDATSVIEAPPENWKIGKPLASPGLEIQPRKPEFTILQRLSASPGNPLCRIEFGRDGKPVRASVVESSGSSDIDATIESSLYRWRAKGKRLDELKADETADVTIRIIMRQ